MIPWYFLLVEIPHIFFNTPNEIPLSMQINGQEQLTAKYKQTDWSPRLYENHQSF